MSTQDDNEKQSGHRRFREPQEPSLLDQWAEHMMGSFSLGIRMMGLVMCTGLYFILGLHIYAYFSTKLTHMIHKRLGTELALIWIAIGLSLVYNIIYNHFFAMMIKPGNVSNLRRIEKIRVEYGKTAARGEVDINLDDDTGDEKFEGVSKDVKRLVRYRSKTVE